jgi:hypothetical protein
VEVTQCRKTWDYAKKGKERHGRTLSQTAVVSKCSFLFRGAGGRYVALCGKPRILYFLGFLSNKSNIKKLNSMALVRERTIPTERPPPVGEVSANKSNITGSKYAVTLHDGVRDRRQAHFNAVKNFGRSQWPRCLRCGSAVAHLLRSWFQNLARTCLSVSLSVCLSVCLL